MNSCRGATRSTVWPALCVLLSACGECGSGFGLHSEPCVTDSFCESIQPEVGERFRVSIVERYDQDVKTVQRPILDRYPGKACPINLALSAGDSIDVRIDKFTERERNSCGLVLLTVEDLDQGQSVLETTLPFEQWPIAMSGDAIGVARISLQDGCSGMVGLRFSFNVDDPAARSPVIDRGFVADDAAACGLEAQADATCLDSYVNELTRLD